MPVYKYKTFEEAEQALWTFNPDEAYYDRVARFFAFASKLNPPNYPKGIFKYRTIEEANRQSEMWKAEARAAIPGGA